MNKIIHYLGLDVHKDSVAVAIAVQDGEVRAYGNIGGKLADMDRLIKKLEKPGIELRFCYEAGPTGYVLCRHLRQQGYICQIVAPSLIPRKASDHVKTNRRDATQVARLYRAGELTFITVPDAEDEAVRDLVRARLSAINDQRQAQRHAPAPGTELLRQNQLEKPSPQRPGSLRNKRGQPSTPRDHWITRSVNSQNRSLAP